MAKADFKAQIFEEKFYRAPDSTTGMGGKIIHKNSGKFMEFKEYFSEVVAIHEWKQAILKEVEEMRIKAKEAGVIC